MYPLFETIKVLHGKAFGLQYHQRRIEYSFALYYNKEPFFQLKDILSIPEKFSNGLFKLRFLYSNNAYQIVFSRYEPRMIDSLKIVESNNINYPLKLTDRAQITLLLQQKGDLHDILIVKDKLITDTSIANILFYDGSSWVTPSTPLLKGTCREKLLEDGKIKEAVIRLDDLHKFESFSLINAMLCGDLAPIPIERII
jgi:4-amino-4-deoxychorismate lyase